MGHALHRDNTNAILLGKVDGVKHTLTGNDKAGTVVAIEHACAGTGLRIGELGSSVDTALADALRVVFHAHGAMGMHAAAVSVYQMIRGDVGVFSAEARLVQFIGDQLFKLVLPYVDDLFLMHSGSLPFC